MTTAIARLAACSLAVAAGACLAAADGNTGARFAVDPPAFDFGNVRAEKELQKDLTLRNFGSAELVIANVSTTCGCTVVGAYRKRIAPGASTTVRVSFTTPALDGPTEQTITFETNDALRPKVEVKVKAKVVGAPKPE